MWQDPWDAISEEDALAEGFERREAHLQAFQEINGVMPAGAIVFAVEFRLVVKPA